MDILVERFRYATTFTIGKLYVDGKETCFTMEDTMREEVLGMPVRIYKQKGITAIPCGTYKLIMDVSPRFCKVMPHILNVPGFEGIRIHKGNRPEDTEGCILLGRYWDGGAWIKESGYAYDKLIHMIDEALKRKEEITITIKNGDRL